MSSSRSTAALCRRVRVHGDEEAFRELVGRHRRQFYATVNGFRWAQSYVERDDQEQEALIGFWRAAEVYDHSWQAPFGAIAMDNARKRLSTAVRTARRVKRAAQAESVSLQTPLAENEELTLVDTVAAADYWQPEVISEIRHELRVLSTELPQSLSPTEREALERLMLGERAEQPGAYQAVRRLRGKAAAVLNGAAPVARWARVNRRYEWEQTARRSEADRKQRALHMIRDGHTYATVGQAVGADRTTIARWVRQAAHENLQTTARRRRALGAERTRLRERVLKLHADGVALREIARRMDVPYPTVQRWMQQADRNELEAAA